MTRREALGLLAAGAAIPLDPSLGMLRKARALLASADAEPRTFDSHQAETVKTMAEMILPRTETPGATDVGTTAFIDLMLTEWYEEKDRNSFLDGIAQTDARCQSLFGKKFVECSPEQQADILDWLGATMKAGAEVRETRSVRRATPPKSGEDFYPMLRRLTLTAYYTSEGGATDALHFEIIPGHYDGCSQIQVPSQPVENQPTKEGAGPQQ